jgi:hypothetical protein
MERAAEAAPARPEDHRHQQADRADDHQDHADRVDVDARDGRVDGPGKDRTGCNENEADSNAH